MDARASGVLIGAAVVVAASCTAVSGIDDYAFDLTDVGAGAVGGSSSGGAGGEAGWQLTGGAAGAASSGVGGAGGDGGCQPGDTQPQGDCGDCGTLISTCTNEGEWSAPSCENEGPCSQGATQQSNCDSCSQQTCENDCHWSGCELKPGNECEYQNGEHWEYCDGGTTHWRFCLQSCVWASCQPIP